MKALAIIVLALWGMTWLASLDRKDPSAVSGALAATILAALGSTFALAFLTVFA